MQNKPYLHCQTEDVSDWSVMKWKICFLFDVFFWESYYFLSLLYTIYLFSMLSNYLHSVTHIVKIFSYFLDFISGVKHFQHNKAYTMSELLLLSNLPPTLATQSQNEEIGSFLNSTNSIRLSKYKSRKWMPFCPRFSTRSVKLPTWFQIYFYFYFMYWTFNCSVSN